MDYKHCSVIDADGYYADFVLVDLIDEEWIIQNYTLEDGETLIDVDAPIGFVKPKWNDEWVEGATEEEIAQWELDNQAPIINTQPTELEQLRADVDFMALMGGVRL